MVEPLRSPVFVVALFACALLAATAAIRAMIDDPAVVATHHVPRAEHIDQSELLALVRGRRNEEAFVEAFEAGDQLFEAEFNMLDGVGANVGDGSRFTRVPRADLVGPGQWARHVPGRATGPNANSCNSCHIQPFDDGSGSAVGNVHRDPEHSGDISRFIQRNTPHVFALGATQRVAEEMTTQLQQARDTARRQACAFGTAAVRLAAKGIEFGAIRASRVTALPCEVSYDTSRVVGIAPDLVVRPFQWKGNKVSIREFNRGAAHDELGMQAVETAGDGMDGDGDGVVDELSIGDITALTVYLAAQPRPTTKLELASLNLIDPLPRDEVARIEAGAEAFVRVGCGACHVRQMLLDDPVFTEPSRHPAYRDAAFPAGQDPVARGVDPDHPVRFDLTRDQPDNQIANPRGEVVFRLGSFVRDRRGRAVVELYGDLKRHDMGPALAEAIDEDGTGEATFLTRNLWGVGSTAPYLHDGRATTLTEAILEHGGEAQASRDAFAELAAAGQQALIAFLDNLVLFKMVEGEVVVPPPHTVRMNRLLRMRQPGPRRR
jgi:hypothetical protein